MGAEHPFLERLRAVDPVRRCGRVRSIMPSVLEADGPDASLGTLCSIEQRHGESPLLAEIIQVGASSVKLAPLSPPLGVALGARVAVVEGGRSIAAGEDLLGQAFNALGASRSGRPLHSSRRQPFPTVPPTALERETPRQRLDTGLRAIDGLLTLGRGQRVGVFAPAGAGKTSLITRLAGSVKVDNVVICQIGERGREVETLWNEGLSADVRARTTLVAATSDESAAMRVRAAYYAIALADHWRARGRHVLLLVDSMTRLAMAMREVGLAAGEPPTLRAYTPSVFSAIPRLIECCGALRSGGSISAIVSVLCESEDMDDPISEMMKSILDGHILLSRALAEKGHFPAIDVVRSVSRRAEKLVDEAHRSAAAKARALLARYESSKTLFETGLYAQGSDAEIDAAIEARPALSAFLQQGPLEESTIAQTLRWLGEAGRGRK